MTRSATHLAILAGMSFWAVGTAQAQTLGDAAVFPLDGASGYALRLCAAACESVSGSDAVTVTVRGGRDAGYVSYFTPRAVEQEEGPTQVGASVNAFGFGVEGVLERDADQERVSVGAAFATDGWSVGGGLSFDVDAAGQSDAEGAAQVGVDFTLSSGVSIGGGLRLTEAPDATDREVEAGFQMRLDF